MGADGQDHGVEAILIEQVVDREVAAQRLVAANLDPGALDVLDLGEERLTRQPIFGDADRHHAAGTGSFSNTVTP